MDFCNYIEWAKENTLSYPIKNDDAFDEMHEHWKGTNPQQSDQSEEFQIGGIMP